MGKSVSVIIPVYNAEKYLEECLDSVISQSLTDIEIICVNDGSTDGSSRILEIYAARDKRILVLNKENGGLSSARNAGILRASGEYVIFLDSDDYFADSDVLKKLWDKAMHENLDQIIFDAAVVFESESVKEKNSHYIQYYARKKDYPEIKTGEQFFADLQENWDFKPSACMQMLKRNLITENNLFFCEGILHEDEIFTPESYSFSSRTAYLRGQFLARRVHEDSIMTTTRKMKSIRGYYQGIRELTEFAKENLQECGERFMKAYYQRMYVILDQAANLYLEESSDEKKIIISAMEIDEALRFMLDMRQYEKLDQVRRKTEKEINDIYKKLDDRNREISLLKSKIESLKAKTDSLEEQLEKSEETLERVRNSKSFKVGCAVTYLPRKVKKRVKNLQG